MFLPPNASLAEWLNYIESLHPSQIDLGLDRLATVANRLIDVTGIPFVFTVAGTNGKGTTTAALNGLSVAADLKVGWYSSPHLLRFNERIRINGLPVSDSLLLEAFKRIEAARRSTELTYFEFTTLAAFLCFQQSDLDVWVLEVGLGGRLDAVNLIEPDVTVITNIGLDHQDYLGDSLEKIGAEKAGICRTDVPLVLGSREMPQSVLQCAETLGAPLHQLGRDFTAEEVFALNSVELGALGLSIPTDNAAAAFQAFALSPFASRLSKRASIQTLRGLTMPGRMQRETYHRKHWILDVGHNPHAAAYIAAQLGDQKCHFVIAMLSDKDAKGFISPLRGNIHSLNLVTIEAPRGLTAHQLKDRIDINNKIETFDSVRSAIASLTAQDDSLPLFIGGSFYTVAAALEVLEQEVES